MTSSVPTAITWKIGFAVVFSTVLDLFAEFTIYERIKTKHGRRFYLFATFSAKLKNQK